MRLLVVAMVLATALAGCTSEIDRLEADAGATIELRTVTFEPGDITISVGDAVTFDVVQASHTVDFAEGDGSVEGVSKAHSGNLDPGDTFTVTFTEPGTYPYFCAYHSSIKDGQRVGMVGTITVA